MSHKIYEIMQDLCSSNRIKLTDLEIDNTNKYDLENFINSSCIYGNDEIVLGIYEDEELKLLSFFHEFGHSKTKYTKFDTKYSIEKKAWRVGFTIAESYGIYFSNKAIKWAEKQANTYFMWEWREMSAPIWKKAKYVFIDCLYSCFYNIKS